MYKKICFAMLLGLLAMGASAGAMAESDMVEPPFLPVAPLALPRASSMVTAQSSTTTPYEITVLFLYTPDDVRLYGSVAAVTNRINLMVSLANSAYSDSGINLHMTKAGQDLVYYDNNNTTATAFSQLANKTHYAFANVNRRRMETQADFVVLLRPQKSDTSVCGKSYFLGNVANPATDYWTLGGYAYSHVSINCRDFVLVHELGHLMGLAHSRDAVGEPNAGKAYAYGAGYKVTNDFNTVMASTVGYATVPCCRYLPVFSSPTATCTGNSGVPKACGVDSALSNGADAVKAINNIASQLPHFSDDSDGDGMPDWFENFWGFDRFNPADAALDADSDGLSNLQEFYAETYAAPQAAYSITLAQARDTDGDGIIDGSDPFPTFTGSPVFTLDGLFSGSRLQEEVHP